MKSNGRWRRVNGETPRYGRERGWTPKWAKTQDTRASPNSLETHLVRKWRDIGHLPVLSTWRDGLMDIYLTAWSCDASPVRASLAADPVTAPVQTLPPGPSCNLLSIAVSELVIPVADIPDCASLHSACRQERDVPRTRLVSSKRTSAVAASKALNIKSIRDTGLFKKQLKTVLFCAAYSVYPVSC